MRIDEIYHKHEDGTFADFLYGLIKKNSASVASGQFATVIIPKQSKYVYKIWISDPVYEKWMNFCKKNKDNPEYGMLLPKFYKDTVIMTAPFTRASKFANTELKIQRIEKLQTSDRYDNIDVEYGKHYFDQYEPLIQFIKSSADRYQLDEDKIQTEDDKVKEDFINLYKFFQQVDVDSFGMFDGHPGNYMFRNGNVVLTDIFCGSNPQVILSNISWDGTNNPQIKTTDDEYDYTGKGVVPITIPPHSSYVVNQKFVKGRNATSTKRPILNIVKNSDDLGEILSTVGGIDEISGDYDIISKIGFEELHDYSRFNDTQVGYELMASVIAEMPKSIIDKYETEIIYAICENQMDQSVHDYEKKYGTWTEFREIASEQFDYNP